jgi:hypothetical protein
MFGAIRTKHLPAQRSLYAFLGFALLDVAIQDSPHSPCFGLLFRLSVDRDAMSED